MEWPWRLYRDVCPQIKSPSELARGGRDGLGSGLGRRLKMDFQGEIMKDGSRIAGSVQFSCSVVSDSLRPHELQHARPPCPSPNSRSSLRLTSIESVMPSNHLILCHPLLLLPPIPPSIRVFSKNSRSGNQKRVRTGYQGWLKTKKLVLWESDN